MDQGRRQSFAKDNPEPASQKKEPYAESRKIFAHTRTKLYHSGKNGSKGKLSKTSITEAALRAQFESQSTQSITNSTTTSTALNLCLNSFGHSLSTGSAITPKSGDEPLFASFFATPGLAEHHYFRLTQYSLLRAFVLNTTILGLDPSYLGNDDSLSPFTVINPCPRPTPEDLTPTSIQLSTPHHPYLDILSPPKFRDGVLLSLMNDDLEDQLCHELHSGGFTIWGSQPWNAFGMLFLVLRPS